jgi:hypothetical protein
MPHAGISASEPLGGGALHKVTAFPHPRSPSWLPPSWQVTRRQAHPPGLRAAQRAVWGLRGKQEVGTGQKMSQGSFKVGSGGSKKCGKRAEVEKYEEEGELMLAAAPASFIRRLPCLPGMQESFELVLLNSLFPVPTGLLRRLSFPLMRRPCTIHWLRVSCNSLCSLKKTSSAMPQGMPCWGQHPSHAHPATRASSSLRGLFLD